MYRVIFLLPFVLTAEINRDYTLTQPAAGALRFKWIHGSICNALNRDPRVQVVMYNEDTYVMRQNIAIHHDAPFTYLLMGNSGALLIDSGATEEAEYYPLRKTVDAVLQRWSDVRGKQNVPLTIVFTSAEYLSQNQGHKQFAGRPNTTVVLTKREAGSIDLGGRVVQALATPGAHRDGMSYYDPYNAFLHTGDLLFPGRIMIGNENDYLASLEHLKDFTRAHPLKWIMGGQIDMSFLPGVEFMRLITYKPTEHVLELEAAALDEALTTAKRLRGKADVAVRAEFTMRNGVGPDHRNRTRPTDLPPIPTVVPTR
jgi:glyoxylase-like metal-dependent hydrolase (beta-lactamase superfamily II)